MRLWHIDLIPKLPSKLDYKGCTNQLGGQHLEVRMIYNIIQEKGKVNHSVVNYVNNYSLSYLRAYGLVVIDEMIVRGFKVNPKIILDYCKDWNAVQLYKEHKRKNKPIYPEHDNLYYNECIENLKRKGIEIKI